MIKYLGVIGITLMLVEFAKPVEWIKAHFNISSTSKPKTLPKQIIQGLVNCSLCLGFWVGLGFYMDLYMAVLIAFSSELLYRILIKLFIYI